MKISPITNLKNQSIIKYSSKNIQAENAERDLPKVGYTDLVFKSGFKLRKPKIKNPTIEKINNKILSYVEKLPQASKTSKPVIISFEDGMAGFIVDKTKKEGTFISLKMVKGFDNIESFDSIKTPFMALECTLDQKGQMIKGVYYDMPGRMNAIFNRTSRNIRRIQYANAFYKPISENDNWWIKLVPGANDYQYASAAKKMDFRDNELQEYFSELAKKDVSLFAK